MKEGNMEGLPRPAEYRPVVGFEGYRVGDDGSVWSIRRRLRHEWRRLSPRRQTGGYLQACLFCRGKRTEVYVHHIVLEAFIGPRPAGMVACHYDGVRTNNARSNLRWDTPRNNMADAYRHGTLSTIIDPPIVREIRRMRSESLGWKAIARRLGINWSVARDVIRGKTWRHVL